MHDSAQMTATPGVPPVRISPLDTRTILRLRSWLPPQADRTGPTVAGHRLPSRVGATLPGSTRTLCLSPQDWLIVSSEHDASTLRGYLGDDLASHGLVTVDLSHGLASFEVRGPAARDLLSKGCGLDLHPRVFPPGRCARTRFAQLPAIIECVEEASRFELYVGCSYARYLYGWITDG